MADYSKLFPRILRSGLNKADDELAIAAREIAEGSEAKTADLMRRLDAQKALGELNPPDFVMGPGSPVEEAAEIAKREFLQQQASKLPAVVPTNPVLVGTGSSMDDVAEAAKRKFFQERASKLPVATSQVVEEVAQSTGMVPSAMNSVDDVIDVTPKQRSLLEWIKNNKLKTGTAVAGTGLAAASMMGGESQGQEVPPATEQPKTTENQPELGPSEVDSMRKELEILRSGAPVMEAPSVPMDLDVGQSMNGGMEELIRLQKEAEQQRSIARLAEASDMIGSGVSGADLKLKGYGAEVDKYAGQGIKDFEARLAMEEMDPNSPASKGFKKYLSALGVNVKGDFTAKLGKELMPTIYKKFDSEENRKSREQAAAIAAADRAEARVSREDTKNTQRQDKIVDTAVKALVPQYEKLATARKATRNIQAAIARKAGGPGDVAMLYDFVRALDPASVVREGEIALAKSGMSVLGKIKAGAANITQGDILDPTFREGMLEIVKRMEQNALNDYKKIRAPYMNIAKKRGIPEDRFIEFDPLSAEEVDDKLQQKVDGVDNELQSSINDEISAMTDEEKRKKLQELEAEFGSNQ